MSTVTDPQLPPAADATSPAPSTPASAPAPAECRDPLLPDGRANVALLEDQLHPALKFPRSWAVFAGVLGLAFLCLSRLALRSSDLWGHLAYGRWIASQGRLPATEPLLPLCAGEPWVDVGWLSKLGGHAMFAAFGVPGLQFLHAALLTLAAAVLVWNWHRRTGSAGWTLLGLLACVVIDYIQLLIQRPQSFGLPAFALTLVWALGRSPNWAGWIGLPAIYALWANVHGSFPIGLAALGLCALGSAVDVGLRSGSVRLAVQSRSAWRAASMLQLCAAATLLNPSGIDVYADVLTIVGHPNLAVLDDWRPLTLRMGVGQIVAAAGLLLGLLWRWTPRRVTATELSLLIGFGLAALWSARMLVWWGPLVGWAVATHGSAIGRRRSGGPLVAPPEERRGLWTVATLGLAWIAFAYSPFGLQRLHGRPQGAAAAAEFRRHVVDRTPLDAVEYLVEHADELPAGLMYNSHEFGDYLLWAAPSRFQPFVHSHAHLIPTEVWQDFLEIHDAGGAWLDKLDRYGVNTVLVDVTNYMGLIRALRDQDGWSEVFADPQGLAVIFVRKRPV